MLLAIDIGNSNIKFGVYDGDNLTANFQIPTDRTYSPQSIRSKIYKNAATGITRTIVCSVVPELNPVIESLVADEYGCKTSFVANDWDFGLTIDYRPLSAAGTDRLVNCFSAAEKYGSPCIVCSFGTALTIDVVDSERRLLGGLIAPGIKPLTKALHLVTSQLPEIEIEKPDRIIQQTTIGSLQSGIVDGYLAMFTGLLAKVSDEIGAKPPVIATGGLAEFVANETDLIDTADRQLTLDGLRLLADRFGL